MILLLLAVGLINLVIWIERVEILEAFGGLEPSLLVIALLAIGFAHVGLAGIWVATGRTAGFVRLLLGMGTVYYWSWLYASRFGGDGITEVWMTLHILQATFISIPLFVARWRGYDLVNVVRHPKSESKGRRRQFSMLQMMLWVTAMALLFGAAKWTKLNDFSEVVESIREVIGVAIGVALVGLVVVWSLFGEGLRWWIRLLIAMITIPFFAIATMYLTFEDTEFVVRVFVPAAIGQGALLFTFLGVCRLSGYRLLREQISGE